MSNSRFLYRTMALLYARSLEKKMGGEGKLTGDKSG
jgi:hypothetical protein